MIAEMDQRLLEWVNEVLHGPRASLGMPSPDAAEDAVSVYLMEFSQSPPPRGTKKPPLQILLRYLICPQARELMESHRRLWVLLLDASRRAEQNAWTVEAEAPPLAMWRALGITPRPAFVLRVPVRHEYEYRPAPLVTREIVVEGSPLAVLHGTVVGPQDIPVMNAAVDLPSLSQSTFTDSSGRFSFPAVPSGGLGPKLIVVRAKGKRFEIPIRRRDGDGPLLIHIQPMEV